MTEIAKQNSRPTLSTMLAQMQPEIQRALPKHLSGDRFARLVMTSIRKTPKLATCDPGSFFGSLLTAAALGLEPDVNGECYLVPYGRECQLIIGYQGMAKLFWQHSMAKRLSAEYVCERDHFRIQKGLTQVLEHEPATGERGKVIGYYAIAELSTGAVVFDYFTTAQIAALRDAKRPQNVRDPEHWLARKTAVRQVLKLIPKATEVQYAMQVDERAGSMQTAQAIRDGGQAPEAEPLPVDNVDMQTGEVLDAEVIHE